jgi:hypothetical protein
MDWAGIKHARQAAVGDRIPLLLLYAIDPRSAPAQDGGYRTSLDALADVLGIGVVFPDLGEQKSYVRVRLLHADADEDILADFPEIA